MKILLLNPNISLEHPLVQSFQAEGVSILLPMDAEEAFQVLQLHIGSVDLAIIHREGPGGEDEGVRLLHRIRSESLLEDLTQLPVILSSAVWENPQFAEHQNTPDGAHAYLRWPFTHQEALDLIGRILLPPEEEVQTQSSEQIALPDGTFALAIEDGQGTIPEVGQAAVPGVAPVGAPSAGTLAFEPPPHLPSEPSIQVVLDAPLELGVEQPPVPGPSESLPDSLPEIRIDAEPSENPPPVLNLNQFILAEGQEEDIDAPANLSAQEPEPFNHSSGPVVSQEGGELQVSSLSTPEWAAPREKSGSSEVRQAEPSREVDSGTDEELAAELPYLFGVGGKKDVEGSGARENREWGFAQPVGDAVVPGGAANTPDAETLKKYLILREQDVGVLSSQLKAARERIVAMELALKTEKAKSSELEIHAKGQKVRIDDFEREKATVVDSLQVEIEELRFQGRVKNDKVKLLERQVREASDEIERLKDRVRNDIRKIRVREKELENRLEITKKDSEALISGRENKIIELKRKVDLLEFNMDLLQDQYSREKENSNRLRERLAKAAQVVRVATGLLDTSSGESAAATGGSGGKNQESKVS